MINGLRILRILIGGLLHRRLILRLYGRLILGLCGSLVLRRLIRSGSGSGGSVGVRQLVQVGLHHDEVDDAETDKAEHDV